MASSRSKKLRLLFIACISLPIIYNGCSPAPFEATENSSVANLGNGSSSNQNENTNDGNPTSPGNENPGTGPADPLPPMEEPIDPPPAEDPMDPPPAGDPSLSFYFGNADISNAGTPAFLAIGHLQSSMYSCDGGRTWQGYQTVNTQDRCWEPVAGGVEIECDHTRWSAKGVAWGPRGFMAVFGWGAPGTIQLTTNGRNWQQLASIGEGGQSRLGGIAYGNGRYVMPEPYRPLVTTDGGQTFQEGSNIDSDHFNQRRVDFFASSGIFASLSGVGEPKNIMNSTDGLTYETPTAQPINCGNGSVAQSPSRIVLFSTNLCTSDDGGLTWVDRGTKPFNRGITYNGEHFIGYDEGIQHYSSDGINWNQRPIFVDGQMAPRVRLREVTYHPVINRYVAISQWSPRYYEYVQYYHSDDGVNWTRVNKEGGDAPAAPHPIRDITIGFIPNCQ